MTGRQEELIAGWLDASLSAEEQAELLAALKADDGFAAEFAREVEVHRGLQFAASQSAEGDRRAADRILHYVRASHEGTKFAENVKQRARAGTHPGTSMVGPVIAIAAVLMVAVMVGMLAFVQYRHRMASKSEVAETPKPLPEVAPTPRPEVPAPKPKAEDESERRKRIEEELRTAAGTKRVEAPPKPEEPKPPPPPQVPSPQPEEEPVVKPAPTRVESAPVLAWLEAQGKSTELRDGATMDSAGIVRFADGTRIELSGEAKLHEKLAGKRATGKGLTLVRGWLTADVSKQPAGQAFLFATAHAEVQVVGTRLSIASGAETRVDVQEGQVRVASLKGGQAVTLSAGQGSEVGPSGVPRSFLLGLRAVYFDQNNFKGAAVERVDSTIDLFLDQAKNDVPPVGTDRNFAVRWEGRFLAEAAGEYAFVLSVDGQVKFTLDGQELVAEPRGVFHPIARSVVRRKLAAGWHELVVEYTDDQGSSRCQLQFVPPGEALQADNSGLAIPPRLLTHYRR
jgi:hypothetical protein